MSEPAEHPEARGERPAASPRTASDESSRSSRAGAHRRPLDVIIVGAGWSGLLAAKYARAHGLAAVVLEARERVGGVWAYTPDAETITVAEYTRASSSATATEASDFPMPAEWGPFPTHAQMLEYLHRYIERFDLRPMIRTSTPALEIQRTATGWRVETPDGPFMSRFLVVGTGTHGQRNPMPFDALRGFTGEFVHIIELKRTEALVDTTRGRRVLVLGGGESAADVIEVLIRRGDASAVDWSIPNGQQFVRKHGSMFPFSPFSSIADEFITTFSAHHIPSEGGRRGLSMFARKFTTGTFFAHSAGHNIPEWSNDADYFHSVFNKNASVLDHVYDGRVTPKRRPIAAAGRRVSFDAGAPAEYDLIITCLGYRPKPMRFLPETHRVTPERCWRYIFNPDDPALMFVGYVRPVATSIPLMTEAQCELVMRVITGRARLPSDLPGKVRRQRERWERYFQHTSQRVGTLVDPTTYFFDLLEDGGFAPDFGALLRRDPLAAISAYCAPMHAALIHLADPVRQRDALATITRHTDPWMVYFCGYQYLMKIAKVDEFTRSFAQLRLAFERRFPRVAKSRPYAALVDSYRRHILNRDTLTRRTEQYAATLD